jgi:arylsulfatase A-like enzyme
VRASLLGAVLVASLACSEGELPRPQNLLLVLVDTLRADHLSSYGYPRNTSPRIDAWAAENLLFESARSQAPCTFPSVNSLLTSRDPIHFHGRRGDDLGIPADFLSLPEILSERGFTTAAVSDSPIVRRTPSKYNTAGNFGRGFHTFDESCYAPNFHFDAACVNRRATLLLDELGQNSDSPFFLYLHYMPTHGRYQPPASHKRRFGLGY